MNKIDYQALREAAEKATCGEWSLEYGKGRFDGDDALIHREAAGYIPICRIEGAHPESGFDEDFQMEQQANAEFIAAANPAAVLSLLDELDKWRQESSAWQVVAEKQLALAASAEQKIAELESLTAPQLPQPAVVDLSRLEDVLSWIEGLPVPTKSATANYCRLKNFITDYRAAMLQGAEPVTTAYKSPGDFICMLTGRAKYLREKGEIKSPELLERAAAALQGESVNAPSIPNGWKLVPIDPTKDMLRAGQSVVGFWLNTVHCYSKMLAAAPAAPQQEVK